jgi:hypothetical protein
MEILLPKAQKNSKQALKKSPLTNCRSSINFDPTGRRSFSTIYFQEKNK